MKTILHTLPEKLIRLDPDDAAKIDPKRKYQVRIEIREIKNYRKWGKRESWSEGRVVI